MPSSGPPPCVIQALRSLPQFQSSSQDTLIPETPFTSLNFFPLSSQAQNPGQHTSISSIFALSAQHLQIYPSSQSTKTVSCKIAQRGKAMAAKPDGLSSHLRTHMRRKRTNQMLQIIYTCAVHDSHACTGREGASK